MTDLLIFETEVTDLETVLSIENDRENSQFIVPNTKDEHLNLITHVDIKHLMLKSNNNTLIGFVILAGIQNTNKSIEFRRIVIKEKGKGFGRLAIKALKKYCFETLNCHRLWLDVLETNERARYLYNSEGFVEEGRLRDCILVKDEYKSLIVMSILEDEYKKHLLQ